MADIDIHAGDWPATFAIITGFGRNISMPVQGALWRKENIPLSELTDVEIATEETVKKIGGTVGWGAAGAVILGPVGLLAGLLLGGKKKKVTFVAKFKDGRKFLGTTDAKTYTQLSAAAFK